MDVMLTVVGIILIVAAIFFLIVVIPILFGKLFFRWSRKRIRYIFSESLSSIIAIVIGSLVLTGLILLVGVVLKREWAFSGGLFLIYTLWEAIKTVRENIQFSKDM